MVQATILLLELGAAIFIGTNLLQVSGSALKEVHHERDAENKRTKIELNIDLDDIPEGMMEDVFRGNYKSISELERPIAAMHGGDIADESSNMEHLRWDRDILGRDDRLPINDARGWPYCAIGVLDSGCTAVFIG